VTAPSFTAFFDRVTHKEPSWATWRVVAKAIFGLPMTAAERDVYETLSGRTVPPTGRATELWCQGARRSGKSRMVAIIGAFLATCIDYRKILAPGERGILLIVASTSRVARIIFEYIVGLLESEPALKSMMDGPPLLESIKLKNGITIEIRSASYRTLRGPTYIGALADEVAYWWNDEQAANPAAEILDAIRPGLGTTRGPLICISSPFRQSGVMYEARERHWGRNGDPVLYLAGDTRTFNPTFDPAIIEAAYLRDPLNAATEYGSEFRSDADALFPVEILQRCVTPGEVERAPEPGVGYVAAIDPALGGADRFTLSILHLDHGRVIQDVARGWASKTPRLAVVAQIRSLLAHYHVGRLYGDRVGRDLVKELLEGDGGPRYIFTKATKSDAYTYLAPLCREGKVTLLDHPQTLAELASLVVKATDHGRLHIDAARGRAEDHANALALAVYHALRVDRREQRAEQEGDDWRPDGAADSLGQSLDRPSPLAGLDPVVRQWCERHGHISATRCSEGDIKAARAAYRLAHPVGDAEAFSDRWRMRRSGIPDSDDDLMFRRVPESSEAL